MRELKILLEKRVEVGAVMPGSIREQYNVCGKVGCGCKDKNTPRKHGPYNQLSFSTKGKSSTMFIKTPDLKLAENLTASYKEDRVLTQEIGLAMISLAREVGIPQAKRIYDDLNEEVLRKHLGSKPEARNIKETTQSRDKWKAKAVERKSEIEKLHVKVRDLTESRKAWKGKAMARQEENNELMAKMADIKKNVEGCE